MKTHTQKPEEFDGLASQMRDSQWLASEDLDGLGDIEAKIEHVLLHRNVSFEEGRQQEKVYSLCFVGKQKQMVLNSTNRKNLVAKFGPKTPAWIGQKITLYVQDGVRKPGGGTCKGIRIR